MIGCGSQDKPTKITVKVSSLADVEKVLKEVWGIGKNGSYAINLIVEADLRKKLFFHS